VGSLGNAAIFSFHANKTISSGEGGCVVTNNFDLAKTVRNLNSFGMDPEKLYWHIQCGSNRKMSNLVAAFGVGQLERWDELIVARKAVAEQYDTAFKSLPMQRRPVAKWAEESVWLYTLATEKRSLILNACFEHGIDARAVWPLLPKNPIFNKYYSNEYPIAEKISSTAIWLPTWSFMPQSYIDKVISVVKNIFD
jgi:perosamine synthetase